MVRVRTTIAVLGRLEQSAGAMEISISEFAVIAFIEVAPPTTRNTVTGSVKPQSSLQHEIPRTGFHADDAGEIVPHDVADIACVILVTLP